MTTIGIAQFARERPSACGSALLGPGTHISLIAAQKASASWSVNSSSTISS
jgi:hypothetical protein